jgi:hypothetical protein
MLQHIDRLKDVMLKHNLLRLERAEPVPQGGGQLKNATRPAQMNEQAVVFVASIFEAA